MAADGFRPDLALEVSDAEALPVRASRSFLKHMIRSNDMYAHTVYAYAVQPYCSQYTQLHRIVL